MPITYALVSHQQRILCEVGGTIHVKTISNRILAKLPNDAQTHRKTFSYEDQAFNVWGDDNGLAFICTAGSDVSLKLCFSFLQELRKRFLEAYGQIYQTAPAGSLQDFSRVMKEKMEYSSSDPNADIVKQTRGKIEEIQDQMKENIEKVIDRGEKIEILVDQTDQLQTQGAQFKTVATQVKRKMWWEDKKRLCKICVCTIIVIIVLIIAIIGLLIGLKVIPLSAI